MAAAAPDRPATADFATRPGRAVFTRRFTADTEVIGPMLLRLTVEARM